jgi:hypothetical protein
MSRTNTVSFTRLAALQPTAASADARFAENLIGLGFEIAFADEFALRVGGGLTGDEDDSAVADFDNIGIAGGRGEVRGFTKRVDSSGCLVKFVSRLEYDRALRPKLLARRAFACGPAAL